MANALPLLLLGGGALLLMSRKKTTTSTKPAEEKPAEEKPTEEKPKRQPKPDDTKPAPVPGDQVEGGELMGSGFVMTDEYGAVNWSVRRYAGGPQFYTMAYDPDDREMEVATVGEMMEDDLVRLFDSAAVAKEWIRSFIKTFDSGEPVPEPPEPPEPEPDIEPEPPKPEREEALGMHPGGYPNVHVNARYGLVSPYRTPETTVSIRRKSGMVHYPAKSSEARFVGWNPQNPEEALIDIDAKGEYSIMTHDGGPKGVFIAEWVLKVTQG